MSVDWSSLRGLLIDLDGVVYTGRELGPGVARRGVALLAALAVGLAVAAHRVGVLGRVQELGVAVALHAEPGARVRIVGEAGLRQAVEEEGFVVVEDGEASCDWVIAGLDRGFTYAKLAGATRAIMGGARFVATNSDALLPGECGLVVPGAGTMIAAIPTATAVAPT